MGRLSFVTLPLLMFNLLLDHFHRYIISEAKPE